jgi:hypothetical protein
MGAGTASAQDVTKPNEKALQKQCLSLAQRDSARDNSNMAAPAPAVSDSIRTMCDSVNAANPEFQKKLEKQNKDKYPDSAKPDSTTSTQEASPGMTSVSPATPAAPPVTTGDNTAQPATPASPATTSNPNSATDSTTTAPPPPPNPNSSTPQ